jgi:hypothetical protein
VDKAAGEICRSVVIPVHVPDIKKGIEWYAGLLGAQPERRVAENVYAFRLTEDCWLELSERRTRGKVRARIEVDDIALWRDRHLKLKGRVGPLRSADGLVYYTVQDPHGNSISPFQPLSGCGAGMDCHALA